MISRRHGMDYIFRHAELASVSKLIELSSTNLDVLTQKNSWPGISQYSNISLPYWFFVARLFVTYLVCDSFRCVSIRFVLLLYIHVSTAIHGRSILSPIKLTFRLRAGHKYIRCCEKRAYENIDKLYSL